jgi:DNA-binding response OmpR family regulator
MMRILVVEDDDIVADAVERGLSAENFSVHRVSSAETARAAIDAEEFALAVIDVGLPGADGLTLVRRLRAAGIALPTLMLTARCTLNDKVKALDIGADDFLSKPFEPAELAARCRALMRRAGGALEGIVKLNRMRVDLASTMPRLSSPPGSGWCSSAWSGAPARSSPKSGCSWSSPARNRTSRRMPSKCTSRACAQSSVTPR